jgi:predicted transcriptional regulator
MNVSEFAEKLGGKILTGESGGEKQVKGIYCGDLLSWVMSHAPKDSAWITVHTHTNIVAVAALTELSCIIIPEGITPDEVAVKKAAEEGVPVISTGLDAYEICCIAHTNGI